MEDDIDIEEHDVMDNPKIRDIFPDLSLVKIEVPDTMEETEDQYNVPLEYESDTHYEVNIKKENPSEEDMDTGQNEQTDNLTVEPGQIEHSNEQSGINNPELANDDNYEFAENDNYYEYEEDEDFDYNNRIIIGSKPVPDYDTLYEEALHSNVTVSLENWEDRLKSSLCYCNDCEILFPTVNALDAHKSISHSFLVALDRPRPNTARKSTTITSSRYCNHCDKIFTDDTALIKHLYELLPLNNFRKPTPEPLKIDANSTRYKCTKCKTYFATFAAGREHKKKFHPTLSNVNIICKVLAKTEGGDPVTVPLVAKKEFLISNSLIPKSVLFQCHICQVNFVSCYSATQHSIKCRNSTEYNKCTICKRKIRAKDSLLHAMQHKYALPGAKLKIYTLHQKMSEKVYVKCPKCSICFDEKKFWVHYGLCRRERVNFVRCHICQIDICQSRYPNHKSKHVLQKCMKKDFVIVKFYDVNEINIPATPKPVNFVQNVQNHGIKTVKTEKIPLYYCQVCGSCKTVPSQRGHKNGACKNLSVHFCEHCGLGFSRENYKKHRSHHLGRKLTLNDFKIINLKTDAEMEVPISHFHCCKRCKIHFLSREKVQLHNCKVEPYEYCEICNKKFNFRAFAPHTNFHTHSNIPELLEKYNSINDMWNVVYSCMTCNLVTMTYDSAVEHSQNHINGLPKPPSKRCDVCDFDIIEPHFKTHTKLHTNKVMIDRTKFRILTFNYEQLFSTEWMAIFSTLPKAHKYQILSKSIYKFSRRFKLNCIINSSSDDIKIFCERCKTAVDFEDTKKHYFDIKCKTSTSYVCKTCHLHFSTLHDCLLHEKNHDPVPKTYKVVTFKDQKDEQFDQRLKDFELSTKSGTPLKTNVLTKSTKPVIKSGAKSSKALIKSLPIKSIPKKLVKLSGGIVKFSRKRKTVADEVFNSNRIKLYKCEKCGSCVSRRNNISKHNCSPTSRHKMCAICKENFYFRHIYLHMELHRQFPHIKKKPLVVRFKPHTGIVTLPVATIFQCECGLHFTSKLSIESHLEICNDSLSISKETCSKCNLLFPTHVLVTHLCKHHSKPMDIRVQLVNNKKTSPLKCGDCSIVFPNMKNYDEHLFTCGGNSGKTCPQCNLQIEFRWFNSHRCMSNQKLPVIKKSASIYTVFRCVSCNISYLNHKSLRYHLEKNHVTCRDIVTCDICKLKFTSTSHNRHEVMHKTKDNYIIKVLDLTTGRYTIRKGKNSKELKSDVQSTVDDEVELEEADLEETVLEETAMEEDKNKEEVGQNDTKGDECDNVKKAVYRVYKCRQCDACYKLKKRLERHLAANHVIDLEVIPCKVCGLKFSPKLIQRHMLLHENGDDEYIIEILDYETGATTGVLRGKNGIPSPIKTSAPSPIKTSAHSVKRTYSDYCALRSKRIRNNTNYYNMQNMTDDNFDSQDEEPSTSKYGFESIDMSVDDNESMLTDADNESIIDSINASNDPLNETDPILPDIETIAAKKAELAKKVTDRLKHTLDINIRNYSTKLYKCRLCNLHFLKEASIIWHLTRNHNRTFVPYHCDFCGLGFTYATLKRHTYIHHTCMKLDKDAFDIEIFDENMLKNPPQLLSAADAGQILPDDNITEQIKPPTAHKINTANETNNAKIHYYKCGNCNVCFIDENTCRKHCIDHKELDSKTYIECKICNFEFLIDSLKKHVTVHHVEEFFIEDLVISEYTPGIDGTLRVEVYQGIDKVQSRLVSTTTDVSSTEKDIIGI